MAGYTILILDDNNFDRMIARKLLDTQGYRILEAETGRTALQMVKEDKKPDLILLDLQMPGMDGFEFLDALLHEESLDIPVIMVSGLDYEHLKIKALKKGADDYVTKPYSQGEFLARIRAVLRRSKRFSRAKGVMEGELSDIGLSELLQNMELASKTGSLSAHDIDGKIFVENGELVHARQGPFVGQDAVHRMFLLERGYFSIAFGPLPDDIPKNPIPLMSVLMNAANEVDEIKDVLHQANPRGLNVQVHGDASAFPAIEKIRPRMPLPAVDAVAAMGGPVRENLDVLLAALQQEKIKLVP